MVLGRGHSEKRDFIRMEVDCEVEFRPAGASAMEQGRGRDLSATGVSFLAERELAEGETLEVRVLPVRPGVSPLHAEATVVRVEPEGEGHRIGCRIERILE
ncbi:MAG: PilZ domain-containing protein [Pseudomonadota bacterium]